jgi:hypothetical protein
MKLSHEQRIQWPQIKPQWSYPTFISFKAHSLASSTKVEVFFFLMASPTWNPPQPHKLLFIEDAKKSLGDRPRM